MRLRRRLIGDAAVAEMQTSSGWKRLSGVPSADAILQQMLHDKAHQNYELAPKTDDLLPYLQLDADARSALAGIAHDLPDANSTPGQPLLPVVPRSFRDFMLYEKHAIAAARGMVRRLMPGIFQITRCFEALTGQPFPKFKPHKLWYRQPIYYLGNHLTITTEGSPIPWPSYTGVLDYELELGAILARPLRNANAEEAAAAIGGFVVLNDFSARDVQIDEMRSGFGPQKAKHFGSAISTEVVTADEISPDLETLTGSVAINGQRISKISAAGPHFTLPEAIAFASQNEDLFPGELFGSGTWPGGAGIENGALVTPGDKLTLTIDTVGSLTNVVSEKGT